MVGGAARAVAAAAVVSAALLLQVVPARALEEESCAPVQATGGVLIQKAHKTSGATEDGESDRTRVAQNQSGLERAEAELKLNYETKTSYCMEFGSKKGYDCWSEKPPSSAPACTADSGTAACRCADTDCRVDNLDSATPTTGRCADEYLYEVGGRLHKDAETGYYDMVSTGQERYCKKMVKNDQWKAKHLVKLQSDKPAANGKRYSWCWHPNKWWNGKCQERKTRYLGESCWSSGYGSGTCAGDEKKYGEYQTSCYEGKCTPTAWAVQRRECECASFALNLIVKCTAKNNVCGGHACVKNRRDGKFHCDYSTSSDW